MVIYNKHRIGVITSWSFILLFQWKHLRHLHLPLISKKNIPNNNTKIFSWTSFFSAFFLMIFLFIFISTPQSIINSTEFGFLFCIIMSYANITQTYNHNQVMHEHNFIKSWIEWFISFCPYSYYTKWKHMYVCIHEICSW